MVMSQHYVKTSCFPPLLETSIIPSGTTKVYRKESCYEEFLKQFFNYFIKRTFFLFCLNLPSNFEDGLGILKLNVIKRITAV